MFRFAAASSKPSTLAQTVIRLGAVAAACSALTWSLSGCGGGSRAKEYSPDSVVSFGDENSAMEDYSSTTLDSSTASTGSVSRTIRGLVYSVNPILASSATYCTDQTVDNYCTNPLTTTVSNYQKTNTTHGYYFTGVNTVVDGVQLDNQIDLLDLGTGDYTAGTGESLKRDVRWFYNCASSTLWNQIVAHNFGKGFSDSCSLDRAGAKTYAAPQAKIANLQTQVAAHRAELHDGVLVTIMIGQYDLLEVYGQVRSGNWSTSVAQQEIANRTAALAAVVKDILSTGAKVVLAYPFDLSKSPMALKNGANEDPALLAALLNDADNHQGFITTLIRALGSSVLQDGRHFAVVETNNVTTLTSTSYVYGPNRLCDASSTYVKPDGVTPETDPVQQVKYCTSNNFVTNGSTATYIWADDTHFAPAGHVQIGSLAATRVFNQF